MAGEGQMLQTARENKGWSLLETEEITKIRVRYIQALEEEDYGILPGATYVKGYLRTYAKQLGLNSDDIIELYSASNQPEDVLPVIERPTKVTPSRSSRLKPVIIGGVALVVITLAFGVKSLYQPKETPRDYTSTPLITAPDPEITESAPKESEVPVQSSPPNVVASTQDGLTAQLVFTQACWLEFKVDSQAPTQATFAAGTTKEIKGTDRIELLSIGNAGGLTVTLNGKTLSSLGKSGEVLRNVVLTKDTLNQP